MSPLSRRALLGSAAAVGAGGALGLLPVNVQRAMAASAAGSSLSSVKHVVILMQENRSFDHYYGTLQGVRGFGDTSLLRFPSSSNVWNQSTKGSSSGGKILEPWHLNTQTTDAQQVEDLDHSWSGTHGAWNNGLWNDWIPEKTGFTMGYYNRTDIPFHYALADAFTICDQYFCSVQGPTNPNRLYQWTGMIDPNGTGGGPVIDNSEDGYSWTTYPEMLQNAGVSWRIYQEQDNFDDNPLAWFTQFKNAATSSPLYTRGMARVSSITSAIESDIAGGVFPTVSWVVAPTAQSEHPSYRPADGANFVSGVLSAIASNQAAWDSTVVFYNFDENDGFFDHVVPPTSPSGTADEWVDSAPIGMGPRVPMTVVSPWSAGGVVCSQVFDHTSPLQFAELVTGVECTNISAWRRIVAGNMTAALNLSASEVAFPTNLPNTATLVTQANSEESLPAPTVPSSGSLPAQESGDRAEAGKLGYVFNTTSWVDTSTEKFWFQTVSAGGLGAGFASYVQNTRTFDSWQYTLPAGGTISDYFSAVTYGGGPYDVDVHGPDGYVRGFTGNVNTILSSTTAHPEAYVVDNQNGQTLALTMTNTGTVSCTFTIGLNVAYLASGGSTKTVTVAAGGTATATLAATSAGRYDYTVTANTGDNFGRRFAGRLYAQ
jgi:phospholipase C